MTSRLSQSMLAPEPGAARAVTASERHADRTNVGKRRLAMDIGRIPDGPGTGPHDVSERYRRYRRTRIWDNFTTARNPLSVTGITEGKTPPPRSGGGSRRGVYELGSFRGPVAVEVGVEVDVGVGVGFGAAPVRWSAADYESADELTAEGTTATPVLVPEGLRGVWGETGNLVAVCG